MLDFENFGARTKDKFGFIMDDDPRLCVFDKDTIEKYFKTYDIGVLGDLSKLAHPPMIIWGKPLKHKFDFLIDQIAMSSTRMAAARKLFLEHVVSIENATGALTDVEWKDGKLREDSLELFKPTVIRDFADVVVWKAARAGDFPLAATRLGTWRDTLTQLERANALSATIDAVKNGIQNADIPTGSN